MQSAILKEGTLPSRTPSQLKRAWAMLWEHRGIFAEIALVTLLPSWLTLWVGASFVALLLLGALAASEQLVTFALSWGLPTLIVAGVLTVLTSPLGDGAITEATLRLSGGERPSLRQVLGVAFAHWRALLVVHLIALASRVLPAGLVFVIGALVSAALSLGAAPRGDPEATWSLITILAFVLLPFALFVGMVGGAFTAKPRLFATPFILRQHDWRQAMRESRALVNAVRASQPRAFPTLNWLSLIAALALFGGVAFAVLTLMSAAVLGVLSALAFALTLLGSTLLFVMLLTSWRQVFIALLFAASAPAGEPAPTNAAPSASAKQAPPQPTAPSSTSTPQGFVLLSPTELAQLPAGRRLSFYYEKVRAFGETAHDLNEMAAALMEIGDLWGARGWLDRARALDPSNTEVLLNLATVHYRLRDAETARTLLREYLRLEADAEKRARVRQSAMLRALLPDDAENA